MTSFVKCLLILTLGPCISSGVCKVRNNRRVTYLKINPLSIWDKKEIQVLGQNCSKFSLHDGSQSNERTHQRCQPKIRAKSLTTENLGECDDKSRNKCITVTANAVTDPLAVVLISS